MNHLLYAAFSTDRNKINFFISLLTVVTQKERESALNLYNPKRAWVMQSVAFGKRADTSLGTTVGPGRCTQQARRPIMPSGIYNARRKAYIFRSFELEMVFFIHLIKHYWFW